MMDWITKYQDRAQAARFANEQDYVDFQFIMIVLREFGILYTPQELWNTELFA